VQVETLQAELTQIVRRVSAGELGRVSEQLNLARRSSVLARKTIHDMVSTGMGARPEELHAQAEAMQQQVLEPLQQVGGGACRLLAVRGCRCAGAVWRRLHAMIRLPESHPRC
jgi:hypothetical protein